MEGASKRKRSDIWNLFTELNSEYARCDICNHELSYKTTITNLRKHLMKRHPNISYVKGESYYAQKAEKAHSDIEGEDEEAIIPEHDETISTFLAKSIHSKSRIDPSKFPKKSSSGTLVNGAGTARSSVPVGSNLQERGLNALEAGLWADCKFLVGDEKEEIQACKILLSIASPVFAAMFFGDLTEIEAVEIPDVEPSVFKKLLQFIYTHKVDIYTNEEAFKMIDAAHEYMIPDLVSSCTPFLEKRLNIENMKEFCHMLDIVVIHNITELKEMAIKEVQNNTTAIFQSPEFLNLSSHSLMCILQRGHLNVESEVEVIDAAVRWATARCDDGRSPREVLKESNILKYLRFMLLTERELEVGPVSAGLLSSQEVTALKNHIRSEGDLPPPESLCTISKPRKRKLHQEGIAKKMRIATTLVKVDEDNLKTENFENDSAKPLVLLSVTLPTQDGSRDTYDEDIDVEVFRILESQTGSPRSEVYATGSYIGNVKYRDQLTVQVTVQQNALGSCIRKGEKFGVSIRFHKSGTYPVYYNNVTEDILCAESRGHVIQINYRT